MSLRVVYTDDFPVDVAVQARWFPPLTTKLSFPAQIWRCQALNFATRVKNERNFTTPRPLTYDVSF